MILDNDAQGTLDEDGDGVPDEVEDVGAVLLLQNQLYSLAWLWYSDVVYGGGDDLEAGIKQNEGWKAFTADVGVWGPMSQKDQASKNNLIFMAVDRTDRATAVDLAAQARGTSPSQKSRGGTPSPPRSRPTSRGDQLPGPGGGAMTLGARALADDADGDGIPDSVEAAVDAATKRALEATGEFRAKADRQLSRAEFVAALVKLSIERFVKNKHNPANELDDVSDAVEKLFLEHIAPGLSEPAPGAYQPKLPVPDAFRHIVCYTQPMSDTLRRLAPSLRVIFAGLAKVSFERSRSGAYQLPKLGKAKVVKREGGAVWTLVPGHVSYVDWCRFIDKLGLRGANIREVTLCFLYSIMCVVDGMSDEGRVKEANLPFEGFMEAIVRLATAVPLPTDAQLEAQELTSAEPFMAALEAADEAKFAAFADAQACEWGAVPDPIIGGDMSRRVALLVEMLIRRIKRPKDPDAPLGVLTRREFRQWAKERMGVEDKELPEQWAKDKQKGEE